jgi:uncharacterized protein YpmB
MKVKVKDLSEYIKHNRRFVLLLLIVVVVLYYVVTSIFVNYRMDMAEDLNEVETNMNSSETAFSGEDVLKDIIEGNIANGEELNESIVGNGKESNYIYLPTDSADEIFNENIELHENEDEADGMGKESDEKDKLLSYEEILAMVNSEKQIKEDALEDMEEGTPESNEEELEPEPEPKPEPEPESKPEPEPEPKPELEPPVVEVKNIELIIHIHFEDENGKSLPGEKVEITVSKIGGGYLNSAFSDGEEARLNVSAVNCIISGALVPGFVDEGNKEVHLSESSDDAVKHISYKYKKIL